MKMGGIEYLYGFIDIVTYSSLHVKETEKVIYNVNNIQGALKYQECSHYIFSSQKLQCTP